MHKLLGWIGAAISIGGVSLHWWSLAKDASEVPRDLSSLLKMLNQVFSNVTLIGWIIFLIGLLCLLAATSEWWRPAAAQIFDRVGARTEGDSAASHEASMSIRDMHVWEPFYLLDPNYLHLENHQRRKINQTILDALAEGQLFSWGRPVKNRGLIDELDGVVAQPRPEPIAAKYWRDADFTYLFFDGNRRDELIHATPEDSNIELPSYRNIMFNKANVIQVFGIQTDTSKDSLQGRPREKYVIPLRKEAAILKRALSPIGTNVDLAASSYEKFVVLLEPIDGHPLIASSTSTIRQSAGALLLNYRQVAAGQGKLLDGPTLVKHHEKLDEACKELRNVTSYAIEE